MVVLVLHILKFRNLASQHPSAERGMRNDGNSKFGARLSYTVGKDICRLKQDFGFDHFNLMDLCSTSNRLRPHFRELNATDPAFLDKLRKSFNC